jgi:hypothetical protein
MYIINASISLSSFLFVDASTVGCPTFWVAYHPGNFLPSTFENKNTAQ